MWRFIILLSALALASCTSIGPQAISSTRNSFNEVINETSTQQLLLNLVRAKKAEIPTFVDVAETDSTNAASIGLAGGSSNIGAPAVLGALTGTATASDSELYRLIPVQGFALIQQVSTPISPDSIVKLFNSDFDLAPVLQYSVDRLTPGFADYARAQDLLMLLDDRGAVVFSAQGNSAIAKDEKALLGNKQATSDQNLIVSLRSRSPLTRAAASAREGHTEPCLNLADRPSEEIRVLWKNLTSLYGVKSDQIVLRGSSNGKGPFYFTTRSAIGTLRLGQGDDPDFDFETPEVASAVRAANLRVPCRHKSYYYRPEIIDGDLASKVEKQWAALYQDAVLPEGVELQARTRQRASQRVFIIIEQSVERPRNPYVAVYRKGLWYAIDDDDETSKVNFQLLNQIVTIQSIPVQAAPLTPSIPVK